MNIKLASIVTLLLTLSGCSSNPRPEQQNLTGLNSSLAEASYSVSRSIVSLAETAQASHPTPVLAPPPNPETYGMAGLTSVDWSGPVQPLIGQIAKTANYRMRVLGPAPGIPVLVTINAKNVMLADILRDVGYQCGRRAEVVVFPRSRVIELRYAPN
jgi:defect-in-organelle-trafficking protein DotD